MVMRNQTHKTESALNQWQSVQSALSVVRFSPRLTRFVTLSRMLAHFTKNDSYHMNNKACSTASCYGLKHSGISAIDATANNLTGTRTVICSVNKTGFAPKAPLSLEGQGCSSKVHIRWLLNDVSSVVLRNASNGWLRK